MRDLQQIVLDGIIVDRVMRSLDDIGQKVQRIGNVGIGDTLEKVSQRLDANVRGKLAMHVPAHAVCHYHEQRIPAVGISHTILVVLAPALSGRLIDGEFHDAALRKFPCSGNV
jgi:hypothetical protein